tara:strand:+ start:2733 stop:3224 length:492 start_codon:yes stop_codon:yes gene_type:complete
MKTYSVLGPKKDKVHKDELIAIGDGFSMLAALFAPIWFLWRGMWLHAALAMSAIIVLSFALLGFDLVNIWLIAMVCLALWFGLEAQNFYVEHLQDASGAQLMGYVSALDGDMAMDLFLIDNPSIVSNDLPDRRVITTYDKAHLASDSGNTSSSDMIFSKNWGS